MAQTRNLELRRKEKILGSSKMEKNSQCLDGIQQLVACALHQ